MRRTRDTDPGHALAGAEDVGGGVQNGSVVGQQLSFSWETLPTFVDAEPPHLKRIVADSTDRVAWLRARARGITATDVAKLSTPASVEKAAQEKLYGTGFGGNAFTEHGRAREPEIASWVRREFAIDPSSTLFHAEIERRHLATPDGLAVRDDGRLELCEIKTTTKAWRSIPRSYLRQIFWQQYVLGAERTLLVWEQHTDFVPIDPEPLYRWIDRDEKEIAALLRLAGALMATLHRETRVR